MTHDDHGFSRACPSGNVMIEDFHESQYHHRLLEPKCQFCDDEKVISNWKIYLEAIRYNWPALDKTWQEILHECREIKNGWRGTTGIWHCLDCPNCEAIR